AALRVHARMPARVRAPLLRRPRRDAPLRRLRPLPRRGCGADGRRAAATAGRVADREGVAATLAQVNERGGASRSRRVRPGGLRGPPTPLPRAPASGARPGLGCARPGGLSPARRPARSARGSTTPLPVPSPAPPLAATPGLLPLHRDARPPTLSPCSFAPPPST